jgi:putative sigma-54 modulation protein
MNVNIQSVHFDADKKLIGFINEKVNKLEHFFEGIVTSDVTLKIDKSSDTQNKIAEIKMQLKGADLFAKKQCKTFEEAVDTASEALRSQITKHKDKLYAKK